MKFKSKEVLIIKDDGHLDDCERAFNHGVEDAFKSFAERVEFYKKYMLDATIIEKEDKEAWRDRLKHLDKMLYEWLFDYCFGGI